MKLFYKNDYKRVLVEKEKLQKKYKRDVENLENVIHKFDKELNKLKSERDELHTKLDNHQVMNELITKDNINLKAKLKELQGAKGGYVKHVNKLTNEIKDLKAQIKGLEKQLEESMTDKYIVRKLKPTKPSKQTMAIKSSSVQSRVAKMVKENL